MSRKDISSPEQSKNSWNTSTTHWRDVYPSQPRFHSRFKSKMVLMWISSIM